MWTLIILKNFTRYNYLLTIYLIMVYQTPHVLPCPKDEISWKNQESVFSCGSLTYHCGISVHGREFEFCAFPISLGKGFCPLFDTSGDLNIVDKCSGDGCPFTGYFTNELYKYPSCLNTSNQDLRTAEIITTENSQQKHSLEVSSTDYHTSVSNSVFVHTSNIKIEYSTRSPLQEIYLGRLELITMSVVYGTSVVINMVIAIYLMILNKCLKRTAKRSGIKRESERVLKVTTSEVEDNLYCEISEIERHDQENDTSIFDREEGGAEIKGCDADEVNEVLVFMENLVDNTGSGDVDDTEI